MRCVYNCLRHPEYVIVTANLWPTPMPYCRRHALLRLYSGGSLVRLEPIDSSTILAMINRAHARRSSRANWRRL